MGLKTLVAVTAINNLSDARYCAGMGADIISFCLSEGDANAVTPETVQEIAGWLAGVQVAGEFSQTPAETINELAQTCSLQLVQLNSLYLLDELSKISVPVIQQVSINKDTIETELLEMLQLYRNHVQYFLISSSDFTAIDETNIRLLTDLAVQFPVLIGFGLQPETIPEVLEKVKPAGIALKGGQELKPGLKNFDELEAIFEAIEE